MKTVCGFCGVGCGLNIENEILRGDSDYIINLGKICSKGANSLNAMQLESRLESPLCRTNIGSEFMQTNWHSAINLIAEKINSSQPKRVAFYLSGQMLTEDYYVANKLAKGFIGTSNVDTNSRTCMSSAVVAYKMAFGVDYVPVTMQDVAFTNLIIFLGSNPLESHVIFGNQVKSLKKSGLKIITIDPRQTDTAKMSDLHLAIKPGSDIDLYNALMKKIVLDNTLIDLNFLEMNVNNYKEYIEKIKLIDENTLLARCGVSKQEFEQFFDLIKYNKNIITCYTMGANQSVQGVDKNLAIINFHLITGKILTKGNGPFSLTGQPNAMGGREVGGLSTMLAVHRDFDEQSVALVKDFWNAPNIAKKAGLTAMEIIEAANKNEIDVLIICHTDPVYHLPNRSFVEQAFKKIALVVEINAYANSETAKFAHIKLPATPWGEKEGTQTNQDRTVTKQNILKTPYKDSKPDWEIFSMLATALGFADKFAYKKPQDIFCEYQKMCKLSKFGHINLYETSYEQLAIKPFRWGEDMLQKYGFFTENKKANMYYVENLMLSEQPTTKYPFILLTGRTRDQWHSGTKTANISALLKYKELEFVEICKADASDLNVEDGDIVEVSTCRGSLKLMAKIVEHSRIKTIFIPISTRGINYLTNNLLDAKSKEPDYNHSAAKITLCKTLDAATQKS